MECKESKHDARYGLTRSTNTIEMILPPFTEPRVPSSSTAHGMLGAEGGGGVAELQGDKLIRFMRCPHPTPKLGSGSDSSTALPS